MKILTLTAFLAFSGPAIADMQADFPTLVETCGAVPTAPVNVRRDNPIKPLQKSVGHFIEQTEDRIACANDLFADSWAKLGDIKDRETLERAIDLLNADFADYFAALNEQSEMLAKRVNRQVSWSDKTLVAPTKPFGCGQSSKEGQRLCDLRRATLAAHVNRTIYTGRVEPANWTPVDAPQFVLD